MSAEDIEYMDDYKEFPTKESALDWLDNYLNLDERNNLIRALQQEPRTGHWILTDVEGNRVWHCRCSECGKDPQDYIGGSEDWWLIEGKLPKFCPNCGSDNREVEE